MNYLKYEMSAKGFVLGSKGQGNDQVHGLALCSIGLSAKECRACLSDAGNEIHQKCPYSKIAIMWYKKCLLKYSNKIFFGQIYNQKTFYVPSSENVSELVLFDMGKIYLLSNVSKMACQDSRMAATGELQLDGSTTLYGLAQCTRDLSSYDCGKCLDGAISLLQSCCQRQEGARVSTESCSIRYEIYKFFNMTSK